MALPLKGRWQVQVQTKNRREVLSLSTCMAGKHSMRRVEQDVAAAAAEPKQLVGRPHLHLDSKEMQFRWREMANPGEPVRAQAQPGGRVGCLQLQEAPVFIKMHPATKMLGNLV